MSDWEFGRAADDARRLPCLTHPYPLATAARPGGGPWPAAGRRSPGRGSHRRERRLPGDYLHGAADAARYPFSGQPAPSHAAGLQPAAPRASYYPWPPAPYPAYLRNAVPTADEWREAAADAAAGDGRCRPGSGWQPPSRASRPSC